MSRNIMFITGADDFIGSHGGAWARLPMLRIGGDNYSDTGGGRKKGQDEQRKTKGIHTYELRLSLHNEIMSPIP